MLQGMGTLFQGQGGGGGGGFTQGCKLTNSANEATVTGVGRNATFDTVVYDTDGMHDFVADNTKITIQTPGKYLIIANISFDVNGVGARAIFITKNAVTVADNRVPATPAPYGTNIAVSCVMVLAKNDYIQFGFVQGSGGNLNTAWGIVPEFPFLSVDRIQ